MSKHLLPDRRSILVLAVCVGLLAACNAPVRVTWKTETEMNTAGFNLYRGTSPDGPFDTKVNRRVDPAVIRSAHGQGVQLCRYVRTGRRDLLLRIAGGRTERGRQPVRADQRARRRPAMAPYDAARPAFAVSSRPGRAGSPCAASLAAWRPVAGKGATWQGLTALASRCRGMASCC